MAKRTDPQYDPLLGEISEYQRQRRVRGARGAQELIRRTAGGAAGLTPAQIEAGALPGFERPLGQRETLALQRDIASIMGTLEEIDQLREEEKSRTNRQMASFAVQLAGQESDMINAQMRASSTVQGTSTNRWLCLQRTAYGDARQYRCEHQREYVYFFPGRRGNGCLESASSDW